MKLSGYGLIERAYEEAAYVFGGLQMPHVEYLSSGDWESYLPTFERQRTKHNEETNGCTVFGTLNQVETFIKFLYKKEYNFSERYTYIQTPVNPNYGADPQMVYECIRKNGLIPDKELPMTETASEFYDESKLTEKHKQMGARWTNTHQFMHEWLWNNRPDNYLDIMKDALKTSPLGVSVTAWHEENGVYVDNGERNNHWCMCFRIDDDGIHVYDTYENAKKVLSLDHNIRVAKRIWVNDLTVSGSQKHKTLLEKILSLFMRQTTLTDIVEQYIGKDASPKNKAKSEVACAETVSFICQQVYKDFPEILGTWSLRQYLESGHGWKRINTPEPNSIVVSATGTGLPKTIGHTGIVLANGVIASNNSFGQFAGKLTKNYTVDTWKKRYVDTQGMEMLYYKHD